MKVGDHIKKIFNSFDFMGNRIKRLRVDTPSEKPDYRDAGYDVQKDFVANKEYVDKVTTYDTEKALKYKNPFLQWWMKNVQGLPYKELWDDLLFPRLAPIYVDPVVETCKISVINSPLTVTDNYRNFTPKNQNKSNHTNSKYLVWNGQTVNVEFSIGINPGDRISGVAGRISVQDEEGNQLYGFNSDTTSDTESNIKCSFPYSKTMKIFFIKQFNSCPTKNDSYNEPSPAPNPNYELKFDITHQFETECLILDSFLTLQKTTEGSPSTVVADYLVSNKCIFNATSEGIFDIAIPDTIKYTTEYCIKYVMYEQTKNTMIGTGIIELHNLLKDGSKTFTKNGINYTAYQYNFGCTEKNTEVVLYPEFLRLFNS
jgi:hypothetical protein